MQNFEQRLENSGYSKRNAIKICTDFAENTAELEVFIKSVEKEVTHVDRIQPKPNRAACRRLRS